MKEKINCDNISNLFLESFSFQENSFDFSRQESNNLDYKDIYREEPKKNIMTIFNNNFYNQIQELNQRENNEEVRKYQEKKNNFISYNFFMKIHKPSTTLTSENNIYRKDAYYKHFKVILGKYIKNKINELKNKCFPYYSKNNFSTPSYKYTGNPKEKDNFCFLYYTIKDILIYAKDDVNHNRQYNNELIIKFIEMNENRTINKIAYAGLINFLNNSLENVIIQFYDDEIEYNKLKNDSKCIRFDFFFKRETGISLLEKYGFLKAVKKYNTKNEI